MSITSLPQQYSKAPTIVAAVMCITFALGSILLFWSSVITVRPEAVITQWEQNKEEINQALAITMIARLKQSIAINPLDANSHLLLARYYEALINSEVNNKPITKKNQYTELAQQEYEKAIKQQASWDYAWAKLASFYSNQQSLNEINLMRALSTAMLLGPYERENQQVIIPLIFKHWSLIANNKQAQTQAIKIIKHALSFYPHAPLILSSANEYQRLTELAPLITKQWHKNRLNKYLREAAHE